jgi:hemolysin III
MTTLTHPPRHYPTAAAKCADLVVHVIGLTLALIGGIVLLILAVRAGSISLAVGVGIYAAGLLAMLAFSTAYNFAPARRRPLLRRLDHAGIFLMIAGSYTPFTTQSLTGGWAIGMTAAVWSIAAFGALGKLFLPGLGRRFWVAVYLALGWLVVVALKPMIDAIAWYALLLLVAGGVLYVVAAAAAHWAAILLGVVLAAR